MKDKITFRRTARFRKDIDSSLFKLVAKEIDKYFLFNCENCEQWNIAFKDEDAHAVLTITCKGESKRGNRE